MVQEYTASGTWLALQQGDCLPPVQIYRYGCVFTLGVQNVPQLISLMSRTYQLSAWKGVWRMKVQTLMLTLTSPFVKPSLLPKGKHYCRSCEHVHIAMHWEISLVLAGVSCSQLTIRKLNWECSHIYPQILCWWVFSAVWFECTPDEVVHGWLQVKAFQDPSTDVFKAVAAVFHQKPAMSITDQERQLVKRICCEYNEKDARQLCFQ